MKRADIERLKLIDAGTLARFAQLPSEEQARLIRLTRAPVSDPKVPKADREIAAAHARQLKKVAGRKSEPKRRRHT